MVVVSVSAFFIHQIKLWGAWSPIHLLAGFTLVGLGVAVHAARHHVIARHQRATAIFWVRKKAKGGLTMQFAKPLLAAFALGSMVALPAHAELDVASLKQSIETSFESEYPKLDALYKDIHAHPEIAFEEEKTAAKTRRRDARDWLRGYREGRQDRAGCALQNGDGPTIMVLQYRRLRSRARRRRAQWRPAASRQPFPAVRAGAEANHPDQLMAQGRHKSPKVLGKYVKRTMRQVASGIRKRQAARTNSGQDSE
jgi:hypothetical protein